MRAPVFIGDELTAAGFRLTGIETLTPSREEMHDIFAAARRRAEVVVLTAEFAAYVPVAELEDALSAETPIVVVIADILARTSPPDLTRRLRTTLGLET